MGGTGDALPAPGSEAALRRAFLLLRDPLAFGPRALGHLAVLAWLVVVPTEWFGEGAFPFVLGGAILLSALAFLARRRTLRIAAGDPSALCALLRDDLKQRSTLRPFFLVSAVLIALGGALLLFRVLRDDGSPSAEELGTPLLLLLLLYGFSIDYLVLFPRALRLAGPPPAP